MHSPIKLWTSIFYIHFNLYSSQKFLTNKESFYGIRCMIRYVLSLFLAFRCICFFRNNEIKLWYMILTHKCVTWPWWFFILWHLKKKNKYDIQMHRCSFFNWPWAFGHHVSSVIQIITPNQWWLSVSWIPRNKFQWYFDWYIEISVKKMHFITVTT